LIRLISSNSQEIMAAQLAAIIQSTPQSPLQPRRIIIQSDGMANWLKNKIADHLGAASNLKFIMPSNFFWDLYRSVLPQLPERSPFVREQLRWRIYKLLPDLIGSPEFAPLTPYFKSGESASKLSSLANEITDVFDHYLMYRPDWIEQWSAGNFTNLEQTNLWQGILWHQVFNTVPENIRYHRVNIAHLFNQALRKEDLPKQIILFGITELAPIMLEQLKQIAKHTEVILFWQNPSSGYWGDLRSTRNLQQIIEELNLPEHEQSNTNPLLANWGQQGRNFLNLLIEAELFNENTIETEYAPIESSNSLLAHLQTAILEQQQTPLPAPDHSLVLASCHTPMREVQALKQHLLSLFNRDPDLKPNDIAIMVPDLETYAPFFESVFDRGDHNTRIPVAVSDRSEVGSLPIYQAIESVFLLYKSRFTRSDALDLLGVELVREKFSIAEADLETIRYWIDEAKIHWGLNDAHWHDLDVPTTGKHHFNFGIERLLTSLVFNTQEQLFSGRVGEININGTQATLLGNFIAFIRAIENTYQQMMSPKSPLEWADFFQHLVDELLADDNDERHRIARIKEQIGEFFQQLIAAQSVEPIAIDLVADALLEHLTHARNSQRFVTGRVNIVTFLPMRAIPFKVVAMVGMNEADFPRRLQKQTLNLSQREFRLGDRHPTHEDRYLFLEAILAAQNSLYISWLGRNTVTNDQVPPSILVEELVDYLSRDLDKSYPVRDHKLHAFNSVYYEQNNDLGEQFEIFGNRTDIAIKPFDERPLTASDSHEVSLEQLVRFYRDPLAALLAQLGVKDTVLYAEDFDQEPFSASALSRWQFRKNLSHSLLFDLDFQHTREAAKASGLLPAGTRGDQSAEKQAESVRQLITSHQHLFTMRQQQGAYSLQLNVANTPVLLSGSLNYRMSPQRSVYVELIVAKEIRPKHKLEHRIKQLFANAVGLKLDCILLNDKQSYFAPALSQEEARIQLTQWLDLYRFGLSHPIALTPDIAEKLSADKPATPDLIIAERLVANGVQWEDNAITYVSQYIGDALSAFKKGVE